MTDRRRDARSSSTRVRSIAARVRAGHDVVVLDLSPSGALIEGARPLPPGARIDVQLSIAAARFIITAQVVRCTVAALDAGQGITYHAGLSFEHRMDCACEEETLSVSRLPDGLRPELTRNVEQIPSIGSRPCQVASEYAK